MPSPFAMTCWPKQFLAKWLAVLFGAFIVGLSAGYFTYRPKPKLAQIQHPIQHPKLVQIHLRAIEIYADGTQALVPAEVWTAGHGREAIKDSYQGKLSADKSNLTPISREVGSDLNLIYQWQNTELPQHISPWPNSTLTKTVAFKLKHPNPHKVK